MSDAPATIAPVSNDQKSMDDIMALCKRRGFIYQASEIYGGINGFWDYGPLGTHLKKNLRDAWWQDMVLNPPMGPDGGPVQIVPIDSCIIQNPKVWEASGHVGGFNDPMVDCKACKGRFREDHIPDSQCPKKPSMVPGEFKECQLTEARAFNLMFPTVVGATGDWEENKAYLRPETAQGIFINFKNVMDSTRVDVPFGIAQIGKAFRNEVTPRNFTFRSREFEQMEIEFFCHPEEAAKWYVFWRDTRHAWWQSIGLSDVNLTLREHDSDELAHYAKEGAGTSDIEYRFPFTAPGFGELEGVADRSTYDLSAHEEHSRAKMQYLDRTRGEIAKNGQPKGEWVTPNVIEPSGGLDRGVLALLCEAYTPDESRPSKMFMRFHPRVSPIKAAVFPLVNKDGMPEVARKLADDLKRRFGVVEYDPKQNIGKRYARMDEAGCPFCFTVDSDTLSDQTVTVRDRDSAGQQRMALDQVPTFVHDQLTSGS
ncbi:MAG: glycine--tRNA ligase [Phycisphaerales bacterium JB043]